MTPSIIVSSEPNAWFHFFPTDAPARNSFTGPLFILTTAGQAIVEIDNRSYTLQAGTLLTLLPYHLLHTLSSNDDFRCLLLAFTFDSMAVFPYMLPSYLSEQMENMPYLSLTTIESQQLISWHNIISRHHRATAHPCFEEIQCSLLFIFTAEVNSIYSGKPTKPTATHDEELTAKFFKLLHSSFRTRRDVSFYAGHLCLSTKHLAKVIQKVTGHVPSFWMADFTVREAKMLLKSSSLTISQVSEELNFPNSSFFARYFKRHTHMAPQAYRLSQKS